MNFNTNCAFKEEPHPFDVYITKKCRFLILGTFPAKPKDRRFTFFYPSGRNRFWEVMSIVSGITINSFTDPLARHEREIILDKLNVGLADMGSRVLRQADSSMDINIFPIEFQDIFRILEKHPGITHLILTSKGKGNSAYDWFKSYCKLNRMNFTLEKGAYPMQKDLILVDNRKVKVVLLPSTSNICRYSTPELVQFYRDLLTP
ncbi:hypothetical protein [Pedobacter sp. WC2423]|uniref:hypothetical protein n=1 Tax=Pedobacter sp. WC2423 TaxID=3234142 RepID=UPI003466BB94